MENRKRPSEEDYTGWSVEESCRYLRGEGLLEWEKMFREQKLTGVGLKLLDDAGIGVNTRKMWKKEDEQSKVFNDPIHGHVELHPFLIRIIDTPQFQRLRNIKQLGGTYFVFPGASHNRFEHSIGVSHLAGQLVKALHDRQPELDISPRDILCVQIAGLCHDLGHGPFSHMFQTFIQEARPTLTPTWKHEKASLDMFDHLVEKNMLKEEMVEPHGLVLPEDLDFIKELIAGPLDTNGAEAEGWPYKGRPKDMSFLYDIVANKRNGIDVDKWDYFARDCYHLGIKNNFDHQRFIMFARVCEVDGQKQICIRDKEEGNLYDMFHTRNYLHTRAYQHSVCNIIEVMIAEAFVKADPHIKIKGSKGEMFTLSEAIDDMEAYTKLTDHVFEQILNSSSEELEEPRQILQDIVRRRLYKCLGKTNPRKHLEVTPDAIKGLEKELAESTPDVPDVQDVQDVQVVNLQPDDFVVDVISLNYGMKDKNPINNVRFYCKTDPTKAFQIPEDQVSKMLPAVFNEQWIRVYCKKRDGETVEAAKKHFVQWCINKNPSTSTDADITAPELIPVQPDDGGSCDNAGEGL